MYSEAEWLNVKSQAHKRLIAVAALCALGLGITVAAFVQRRQILCMAALILTIFAFIFLYDLTVSPLRKYGKLLDKMLHGKTHEETFTYLGTDEAISMVEGIPCRAVKGSTQDANGHQYEHSFYLDAEKPLPPFKAGERVTLVCHENVIADWRRAD